MPPPNGSWPRPTRKSASRARRIFPTITLSGELGLNGERIGSLSSGPALLWSLGAAAAETLFDAGKRQDVTKQAWASYRASVANYRQTVLTAFQGVEDNLAALRVLSTELKQQADAVVVLATLS